MAINTLCRTLNYFRYTHIIPCQLNLLNAKNQRLKIYTIPQWISFSDQFFCTNIAGIEEPVKAKKKKILVPKITLLSEKDEIDVVTMEHAEKLAKRRDMKLIKIVDFDTKTERPVYKLMSIRDFLTEENKSKIAAKVEREKQLKDDKSITMSSKISENDLGVKIKSMHKMLKKKHGVRVVISVDNNKEKADHVKTQIIRGCQDHAKIIGKNDSAVKLQFILRPDLEKIFNEEKFHQEKSEENAG